ncbi:UNVERIFIED_CONTAM: hypothetical protein Scaly_2968000 [Sesamum calycinum]|uniref:Uncharacterized protein n=1 Tax=Sesamum calycinum TaxID=2727403 RepID=A0AAW2KN81_9LAMI
MYNKNISERAGLALKFEDGVKTFIEWAKCQHGHMDGDKISEESMQDYFEVATVPPVPEEQTPVAHVEPLWNVCTQSQLAFVAKLVDIKVDGHISERLYDRISQWANNILPSDHILQGDYYNTKKLIKELGLSVEKIDACKNGFMLYWKDDVDL